MKQEAAAAKLALITEPLYKATASEALESLSSMTVADDAACAPLVGKLAARQEQLGISSEAAATLLAKVPNITDTYITIQNRMHTYLTINSWVQIDLALVSCPRARRNSESAARPPPLCWQR